MNKIIMVIAMAVLVGLPSQVAAPPAIATELDLNLLNTNGSNINTGLLLTINYIDWKDAPQSMDSVNDAGLGDDGNTVNWSIFNGKSNLYSNVEGKGGTNITITIEGAYEPIDEVAIEGAYVGKTYYLSRLYNPGTDKSEYLEGETVSVTWSATATPQMSNWIMILFYNENDAAQEELTAVSTSATSYAGHTVGASELGGDTIRVSIYYADDASDHPGDLGTSDPISTAYTTAVPEFPLGPAILFGMFIPIYFSMRRYLWESME